MLGANVKSYVKGCNIYLASKSVRYKLYYDLRFFIVSKYWWKDLFLDFVTGLPVSTNWKGKTYNSIQDIVNRLTKMVHYKPVKVTINALSLAEMIIRTILMHHSLTNSIVTDWGSVFTSKFWLSLYYFLGIKWRLLIAFYLQIGGRLKDKTVI